MSLDTRLEALQLLHRSIGVAAADRSAFSPPGHLVVRALADGHLEFLPATSVALQALLPGTAPLARILSGIQDAARRALAFLDGRTMWQPTGTFHLNLAILRRLTRAPLPSHERTRLIADAVTWLDASTSLRAYTVRFDSLAITADGTLIALGIPMSETPWRLREEVAARGYPDQQKLFHITLARILCPLRRREWREVIRFAGRARKPLGDWTIGHALLIVEHEGYLHDLSAYEIVKQVALAERGTLDG
jgi:hypothetical protein